MKKLLFIATLGVAGLVSAKNTVQNNNQSNEKSEEIGIKKSINALIALRPPQPIRVTTVCGATYVTVMQPQEDLYNEWEGFNEELCGHTSYENPPV